MNEYNNYEHEKSYNTFSNDSYENVDGADLDPFYENQHNLDPQYEDYIYEEPEHIQMDRQEKFQVAVGIMDFFLVIIGLAVILLCITLLIALFNWVIKDIYRTFFTLQPKI